jgi:3-deoxy-D-manno-octulosonic-acid transferase
VQLFYSLFIYCYRFGIGVAAHWNIKARKWVEGRKEQSLQKISLTQPVVWMHCASLGEFEQGRPVFEAVLSQYPAYKGVITFFSPSGYEATRHYNGAAHIFYLPLGTRQAAKRFIDALNPALVLWVKYEYWYHFLRVLRERNIPTLLLSASFRNSQPFFKWYGSLHREMLRSFTHLFVQTESSAQLMKSVGLEAKTTVSGDTRFDRVVTIASDFQPVPFIEDFCGNSKVIVAGSTWLDDEEELDHYANTHPEITFILAPHEIDPSRIREICHLFKKAITYTKYQEKIKQDNSLSLREKYNTLIIDNIGMLSRLYRYATITYVGGGFGEDGVHNVLEAAVYGKPVVFGPVFNRYMEAIELLEDGGAFTIETALELEKVFDNLLEDQTLYRSTADAAKNYVYSKKGATGVILGFIQEKRLLTS